MYISKRLLALIMMVCITVFAGTVVLAAKPELKPEEWQEVFSGAKIETVSDGIKISGSGYKEDPNFKFGFRHISPFSNQDLKLTLKFDNFPAYQGKAVSKSNTQKAEIYYLVSLLNSVGWFSDTPGINFVIRPVDKESVSIEMSMMSLKYEYKGLADAVTVKLQPGRKLTIQLKKENAGWFTYINGQKSSKSLINAADILNAQKGKTFLHFGATFNNTSTPMVIYVNNMEGRLETGKQAEESNGAPNTDKSSGIVYTPGEYKINYDDTIQIPNVTVIE